MVITVRRWWWWWWWCTWWLIGENGSLVTEVQAEAAEMYPEYMNMQLLEACRKKRRTKRRSESQITQTCIRAEVVM